MGLEAFQCGAGELSADIVVNQVRFGRVQAHRDLVVGDAGLVETLPGLIGKQTEQVPNELVVAVVCGSHTR
jgi:hypothetical protein